MTWLLSEPVADSLAEYIAANSEAKLAALKSGTWDASDTGATPARATIDMDDFAAVRITAPSRQPEPAYPVCYVRPVRVKLQPGVGGYARGLMTEQELEVSVIAQGVDPEQALRRVLRYMVAIMELVTDWPTYEVNLGREAAIEYEPLTVSRSGPTKAEAWVRLATKVKETALS